jgi:hypothetical protein
MKSGDKFIKGTAIYTLQKLPDFDLWILVGEPKDFNGKICYCQWKGIDENSNTPINAFGGWDEDFQPYTENVELVTVTYRELFKRARDKTLLESKVNYYHLYNGGDPTAIIDIPKDIALQFMSIEEFNHRKHDENS